MEPEARQQPDTYRIRVKECLDSQFANWIGNMTIIPDEKGGSILISTFTDQSALRGLLDQLWNLNITVISVERIEK